jgi:hypothetical protein
MNPLEDLSFSVSDTIGDIPVSPSYVPLSLIGEFQKEVAEFLRGSNKEIKPADVIVAVEEGSFSFAATGLLALSSLWGDVSHLNSSASLSQIDDARARIIEKWQERARNNPNRSYSVFNKSANVSIKINSNSNYRQASNIWIEVEKYILGVVTDMGGVSKPNVHIRLETGEIITVSASQNIIADEVANPVYRESLLHVTADENLITGQLRNVKLIAFEKYSPKFNETEFQNMVESGTSAWADVPDSAKWVDELRGNK